ncbi:hypothetical protein [Paenibacillus sanfengchensis]|uniref:hypothetical protein n=1 Tax=Paenibacillus sanfengchensis TaxID=3119819 RepID=UPI002FE1EF37
MTKDLALLEKLEQFAEADTGGRGAIKAELIEEICGSGAASNAAEWISDSGER